MATHRLKTWPEPFQALWDGRKAAEFRRDDREPRYEVGDWLHLIEYDPERGYFLDRMIAARVTDIRRGGAFGIPEGYCMLSLGEATRYPPS